MKQMRLLIVDDEVLIREGMANYVRMLDMGFDEIRVCESGIQALETVEQFRPDVAIVDVLMPEMDGIETIERMYQMVPGLQIIIISGCNDFSFVRASLRYPVVDYLPKPIQRQELVAALSRCQRKICAVENQMRSSLRAKRVLSMLDQLQEQYLCSILLGRYSTDIPKLEENLRRLELGEWIEGPLIVSVIAMGNDVAGENSAADFSTLQSHMEKRFPGMRLIPMDENHFVLLCKIDGEETVSRYVALMEGALKGIYDDRSLKGVAGISPVFYGVGQMHAAYQSACDAMELARNSRCTVMLGGDALVSDRPQRFFLGEQFEKALRACITACNADRLHALVQQSIAAWENDEDPDGVWHIKLEYMRVYMKLLHLLDTPAQIAVFSDMSSLSPMLRGKQVAAWFEKQLMQLMDLSDTMRISRAEKVCMEIREVIESRYGEPLSLQFFSDATGLSTNYLSQIFVQYTGVSFISYLTNCRMAHAVDLIKHSDLAINVISQSVGYEDPNYFARLFGKTYGMSPTEFRRKRG